MFRVRLLWFIVVFSINCEIEGLPISSGDEDRLHFSGPRQSERTIQRFRPEINSGGSNIDSAFQIPIAVIKGTAAAAQAILPQNTETIEKFFDIPVTTLDAVGNYIRESRPQRLGNSFDETGQREQNRPVSFADQRRQERRERILMLREQERERLQATQEERFFYHPFHQTYNIFSDLTDLLVGGGGGHGGGFFGGHGHGHHHHHKPPKRPSKPVKPSKPLKPSRPHKPVHHGGHGGHSGHGGAGNFFGGGYQVHEYIDEPTQSSGLFSWLQTSFGAQDEKIQNKIAPGSDINDRDLPEPRSL